MPITAQYQTYYGIHLNHRTETWGGIDYNKILVKDTPDIECVSTISTNCTSTASFMLPDLIKNKFYLDGLAYGHFHLYNWSSSVSDTITSVSITLKTLNNVGTYNDIGVYTAILTYILNIGDIIAVPFSMNLDKIDISENEKIVLTLQATTDAHTAFYHDIVATEGNMDIELILPYAYTKGG